MSNNNNECKCTNGNFINYNGKIISEEKYRMIKSVEQKDIKKINKEVNSTLNKEEVSLKKDKGNKKKAKKTKKDSKKNKEVKKEECKKAIKIMEDNSAKDTKKSIMNIMKERADKKKELKKINKERGKLIESWCSVMANCSAYNCMFDTYEIVDEKQTNYGWEFKLYAPDGLSLESLQTLKPAIQNKFGCTFITNIVSSNKYAICNMIYEDKLKCNEIPFNPVKVKPYEICPGVKITGEPILIDLNAAPHILLAGQTRKGKNGSADSIILNWLNSCSEDEIELYLFQCAKVDLIKYSRCRQVKECVVGRFERMLEIINELVENEIPRRLKLFNHMFIERIGENIRDYNELYPDKQLPYIYLIFDEFLELMLQSKSQKDINDIKNDILDNIERIGQMGAAVGIQYMILHQKPEKALCPTFIKNMSSVRICFGFDDESCGRIVLGDRDGKLVCNLPARRAYVNINGELVLLYTTNLWKRRDMFIRPYEDADREAVQFSESDVRGIDEKDIDTSAVTGEIRTEQDEKGSAKVPDKSKGNTKIKDNGIKEIKEEMKKSASNMEDIFPKEIKDTEKENRINKEIKEVVKIEVKENSMIDIKEKENIQSIVKENKQKLKINRKVELLNKKEEIKPINDDILQEMTFDNSVLIEMVNKFSIGFSGITAMIDNNMSEDKNSKKIKEIRVEVKDTKVELRNDKPDFKENNENIKSSIKNRVVTISDDKRKILEDIVSKNIKNIPGWIPYEPKDGDKPLDVKRLIATYNAHKYDK